MSDDIIRLEEELETVKEKIRDLNQDKKGLQESILLYKLREAGVEDMVMFLNCSKDEITKKIAELADAGTDLKVLKDLIREWEKMHKKGTK